LFERWIRSGGGGRGQLRFAGAAAVLEKGMEEKEVESVEDRLLVYERVHVLDETGHLIEKPQSLGVYLLFWFHFGLIPHRLCDGIEFLHQSQQERVRTLRIKPTRELFHQRNFRGIESGLQRDVL